MTENDVSPLALECPSCLAQPGDRCTAVNTTRFGRKLGEPTEHLHQPRLLEARVRGRLAEAWQDGYDAGHLHARAVNHEWPDAPRNPFIPPGGSSNE